LEKVQNDEQLNNFLSERSVQWRFNLSLAPWWGGQYERLIGLFKRIFYKSIGNGMLTLEELQDVVLDVEVALNDRPLSYLEDDVELPVLTPNSMLNINPKCLSWKPITWRIKNFGKERRSSGNAKKPCGNGGLESTCEASVNVM
jgi:hypothetical protein